MAARLGKLLLLLSPTNLLATVVLVGLAVGGGAYLHARLRARRAETQRQRLEAAVAEQARRNRELRGQVAALEARCAELRGFVHRLTTHSRVADVRVVASHPGRDGVPVTTVEFTERGRDGQAFPARVFTVVGKEVYFDALVIKFADDAVKVGDPLRGKSLHLFRRIFGSAQEPREGPVVAAAVPDGVPDAYGGAGEASDFERRLWRLFWHWASHPAEAAREGVRIAQIEAVGIRPVVGASYRITLRHAGGLEIQRQAPQP